MPRIQWTGLPAALRDHLFDRLRERKTPLTTFTNSRRGGSPIPMPPTGSGTRTSARSKSAAKENTRRPSCSQARLPKVRSSEGRLTAVRWGGVPANQAQSRSPAGLPATPGVSLPIFASLQACRPRAEDSCISGKARTGKPRARHRRVERSGLRHLDPPEQQESEKEIAFRQPSPCCCRYSS
jgi:hypothetical protein